MKKLILALIALACAFAISSCHDQSSPSCEKQKRKPCCVETITQEEKEEIGHFAETQQHDRQHRRW